MSDTGLDGAFDHLFPSGGVAVGFERDVSGSGTKADRHGFVVDHDRDERNQAAPSQSTPRRDSVPVVERATSSYSARGFQITNANPYVMLSGRRRGRKWITLAVPSSYIAPGGTTSSTPLGVMIAEDPNAIVAGVGYQLNPGDTLTIDSEAPIWAGVLPGNATGYV
ncbi:MAG: hypothetical protein KGI89_15705, partial [Euryarchaeota archaeon]|nr:hypothetical protein [Euryarchaeota archaeon]